MKREQVIELAKQAKVFFDDRKVNYCFYPNQLLEFAALVAAYEREACAKVCEENADCCNKGSPLHTILSSNAAAIRGRE